MILRLITPKCNSWSSTWCFNKPSAWFWWFICLKHGDSNFRRWFVCKVDFFDNSTIILLRWTSGYCKIHINTNWIDSRPISCQSACRCNRLATIGCICHTFTTLTHRFSTRRNQSFNILRVRDAVLGWILVCWYIVDESTSYALVTTKRFLVT